MVRPLSKELQKVAIKELNEDPERVENDIKHIQEWVKQQPYLNAPTDKQWILGFLRGCKFSLQKTKKKFDTFYTFKNVIPEILKPRDILSTEIQAILKSGFMLPLPYSKNYVGPLVILFRFHNYNTSIMKIESMAAVCYMYLNILMIEDDNLMTSGVLLWADLKQYPLSSLFQLTPTYLKKFFMCLENAIPFRVKGLLGTGSSALAQTIFNLSKGYMKPKLRDRISIYSDDRFKEIFNVIPKSSVPKEYGGENCNLEDLEAYWVTKLESYSTWFTESNQYMTNEALRPGKPVSFHDVIGIDGSFRKLNID